MDWVIYGFWKVLFVILNNMSWLTGTIDQFVGDWAEDAMFKSQSVYSKILDRKDEN